METWKRNLFVCWFGSFVTAAGMSQIAPMLPIYIEKLGVHTTSDVEKWSGLIFGSTFLLSAIVSPIWGKLADKKGRKLMLLRASLGMAIVVFFMAFVQNVYQLLALRMLMGAVSGYISASVTLVATQTPKKNSGWALGTLSTGSVSGGLLGPLLGGFITEFVGIRSCFVVTSVLLLIAFFAVLFLIKEEFTPVHKTPLAFKEVWRLVPDTRLLISLFASTFILQIANMSIQPLITVYVKELSPHAAHLSMIAGMVVAASGLANIIAAPRLGKLADRIGSRKILIGALIVAGIIFIPQAFVKTPWELMGLRFLLGLATAGLLPSINNLVRKSAPDEIVGRVFGYNQSAQYIGTLGGSVLGGQMAGLFGIHYVFFTTSALLLLNALWVYSINHIGSKRRTMSHSH
ncbi:multidrug efflux MFS transporter [Bacillus sp. FJAT-49736]|uniref:multidrug efflux MFS transporter n=1 Tax=Bacillus sp. FJAT-49736 TaxID=2833582 RepID=UPI001BC96BBF|nr:multidrug efflux MFS transporter [Bacillus sp. FJAT-49736]MBS4174654.1 multidrug efflux MFS transporter [Bacillus sp. FJAT-49736]